jgi:hypothetical protein
MSWAIGEDRFRLCSFLGGFLQIVTLANTDQIRESKNFVHNMATGCNRAGNAHDLKLLLDCELLVGARGFEPPTSRSRKV